MERLFYIEREDGGVSILNIIKEGEKIKDILIKWQDGSGFKPLSHKEITLSDIPKSRKLRDAWKVKDGIIVIDPDKSREIIREKRNYSLKKLDSLVLIESRIPNGDTAKLELEAARLRDITTTIPFNSIVASKLEVCLDACELRL